MMQRHECEMHGKQSSDVGAYDRTARRGLLGLLSLLCFMLMVGCEETMTVYAVDARLSNEQWKGQYNEFSFVDSALMKPDDGHTILVWKGIWEYRTYYALWSYSDVSWDMLAIIPVFDKEGKRIERTNAACVIGGTFAESHPFRISMEGCYVEWIANDTIGLRPTLPSETEVESYAFVRLPIGEVDNPWGEGGFQADAIHLPDKINNEHADKLLLSLGVEYAEGTLVP
jgi:hypothetical protein